VGISRDYPPKTRTSKQPIGEILGYEIIPSHPHKYPRSKQGLNVQARGGVLTSRVYEPITKNVEKTKFKI
jgi:hypothetical protein